MRILLILTGGTIACKIEDNVINADSNTAYDILSLYNQAYPKNSIEFTTIQPFTILSENYTANTYNTLIKYLYSCNFESYDGVIITHGSDTLSYTSALVGMLFNNLNLPIILTAADYPLSNPNSNGLSNFSACVEFIKSKISSGVFTAYGKPNNTQIYLATRIVEADPITDQFTPFGNGVVAQVQHNIITDINEELLLYIKQKKEKPFTKAPFIKDNILLIKTYPNQCFSSYSLDTIKAVVVYMYHSATACTVGTDTNILNFIKHCNQCGKPVYLASYKNKKDEYATSCEIDRLNINKLYNISKESAYIKALLAYNQSQTPPEKVMKTNIYFECQ